jgi:carbonic anhydrase
MLSKIKQDLPASIVVFLVALPLCLGVALASGAPLLSGVISGIIGGIVVGMLSGSHTSVSGPAAGLAAVVLSAITQLGNFEVFLLAVVIAGAIQLISGIAKAGFIANYIPTNVIKGLLASIGIILVLKQIPHAVGFDADAEDDFSFFQSDGENTFSELLNMFNYFTWGAVLISALSIFVLLVWDKTPLKKLRFFPASLFVVIMGVLLNTMFQYYIPGLYIDPKHLVSIPGFEGVSSLILLPDFSSIGNYHVWIAAFTIAIIASLETLLNLEAVENLDPHKRQASPNKELVAQGIGNMLSGLIGGIPITSVIVRSSVNIHAGAETKLSTILHGVFLLVSLVLLGPVLNMIPLASLAAILLLTGYKLAKISLFKDMYAKGLNQFIPFITTIVAIIFTDLLIGVLIGLAVSIFYLLKSNYRNPFTIEKEVINIGELVRIELPNQVSFLNKASIKTTLWSLPAGTKVIVDATYSDYVDNDVLNVLDDYKTFAAEKNIHLNILGLKDRYQLDDHIQFVNVLDKEAQGKLKPEAILDILKRGNERFVKGKWTEKYFKHQVNATSFGQNPVAVILSCIDSRTSPELVFDTGLGDVISIRIAGNIITNEILGSIELACQKVGVKLIVVLGHSDCGAVEAAIQGLNEGNIALITGKIEKAIAACNCERHEIEHNPTMVTSVIKSNVRNSVDEILGGSSYLVEKVKTDDIRIVSAFYDTATGVVTFDEKA